jgi:hypothetical protein
MLILSIKASSLMHDHEGSKRFCQEGLTRFPQEPFMQSYHAMLVQKWDRLVTEFPLDPGDEEGVPNGCYNLSAYPWMTSSIFHRESRVLASVVSNFAKASNGKCVLRRSNIRDGIHKHTDHGPIRPDVFGVFATIDMIAGQSVLQEFTLAGALSDSTGRCDCCCGFLPINSTNLDCCNVDFCSRNCADQARQHYHASICGRDSTTIFNRYRSGECMSEAAAARELLMLRILTISIQDAASHPLQCPTVASMTATYGDRIRMAYDYQSTTVRPISFLQWLGVDVFTNLKYDAWVLSTIQARLRTNQNRGTLVGRSFEAFNQLRTFVNHSCRPNLGIYWDQDNRSTTITLRAKTAIRKGEELLASYEGSHKLPPSLKERRQYLRPLFAGDCQCPLCLEQERQERWLQDHGAPAGAAALGGMLSAIDEFWYEKYKEDIRGLMGMAGRKI